MAVKYKVETEEHKRLFEFYYALGDKRSTRQVAEELNLSPTTVRRYASAFKWTDRVKERDKQIGTIVENKLQEELEKAKEEKLSALEKLKERQEEIIRKTEEELNSKSAMERSLDSIIEQKLQYRLTIKSLIEIFIDDVRNGKIKIRRIEDFERLVRLDLELAGEDAGSKMASNMGTLVDALKGSGWDSIPDPRDVNE